MELQFNPRRDIIHAFATPVFGFRLAGAEALNADLRSLILADRQRDPGLKRSNVGGWHSREDFLDRADPPIRAIREVVLKALSAIVPHFVGGECSYDAAVAGWANILTRGGQNRRHVHPGNHVSLVYYVDTGGPAGVRPDGDGALELLDPRTHCEMSTLPEDPLGRSLVITPHAGQLVAFPSWLYHQVNPHGGDGERISIAVNANISNVRRSAAATGRAVEPADANR